MVDVGRSEDLWGAGSLTFTIQALGIEPRLLGLVANASWWLKIYF